MDPMWIVERVTEASDANPLILEFIQSGLVSLNMIATNSGFQVVYRSIQAHPGLNVYPHESYFEDEILEKLLPALRGRLPGESHISSDDDGALVLPARSVPESKLIEDKAEATKVAPVPSKKTSGTAKRRLKKSYISPDGVENQLPKSKLTQKHFLAENYDEQNIQLWANKVAAEIGSVKASAQIRADNSLRMEGVESLAKWWKLANGRDRYRVLTRGKIEKDLAVTC